MTKVDLAMQSRLNNIKPLFSTFVKSCYCPGDIVRTIHKEDLWNCLLSIVFEPPLVTLTEKNINSIQVIHI